MRELLTTVLELAGAGLLIAAAVVAVGLAAGLAVAGVGVLVFSWRLSQ